MSGDDLRDTCCPDLWVRINDLEAENAALVHDLGNVVHTSAKLLGQIDGLRKVQAVTCCACGQLNQHQPKFIEGGDGES